jgi:CHAT domain-containing protein
MLDQGNGWSDEERVREVFDLLQQFKSRTLLERIRDPYAGGEDAGRDAKPTTLARLQGEVLGDDEVLLDIFLGPRVSLLFAVTTETCRASRLAGEDDELGPKLDLYRRLLSARPSGDRREAGDSAALQRASTSLGELLFGACAELLDDNRRILFVPDGRLNLIPLETLLVPRDGSMESPRMLSDWEIFRFPSATVLAWLRESKEKGEEGETRAVLALAGEVAPSGDPLVGARREVQELGYAYENVDVYIGSVGLDVELTAEELGRYDLLHIAAHTVVDDQRPWRSGILLADVEHQVEPASWGVEESVDPEEFIIRASSIDELRLPARLVVLSGCETAGGRVLSGEGVLGLTSAFFSAGVPVTVATLWPVDDRVTARLMDVFYDQLADGETVAGSLRRAQLAVQTNPATAHPFYWAAFVVMGEGGARLTLERRLRIENFILPAAAVGILVIWISLRRRHRGAGPVGSGLRKRLCASRHRRRGAGRDRHGRAPDGKRQGCGLGTPGTASAAGVSVVLSVRTRSRESPGAGAGCSSQGLPVSRSVSPGLEIHQLALRHRP